MRTKRQIVMAALAHGQIKTSTELANIYLKKVYGMPANKLPGYKTRQAPASMSSLLLLMSRKGIIGRKDNHGPRKGMGYFRLDKNTTKSKDAWHNGYEL